MTLVDLTYLQFNLIAVIDAGKHEGISFAEVKGAIRSGDLFQWIKGRFPGNVDMSFYLDSEPPRADEVIAALDAALDGLDGRERKKTGVEHNGVCLLLALTTEAIQQRGWEK
jgi:hypothetical protein